MQRLRWLSAGAQWRNSESIAGENNELLDTGRVRLADGEEDFRFTLPPEAPAGS